MQIKVILILKMLLDDKKIEFLVDLKESIKDEEYISINKKYIFNLDKNLERVID